MRRLRGLLFWMMFSGAAFSAAPVQHLFYSHGYIVEGDNPRPVHPRYGVYDFPAIVAALQQSGRVVHARHRPAGQSVDAHARVLADEVRALLQQGVRPEQIVLLGFFPWWGDHTESQRLVATATASPGVAGQLFSGPGQAPAATGGALVFPL